MATTFKTFLNDDVVTSRTLLHEAIPITGSVVYGTYPEPTLAGSNIKQYTHGMFQSVYDYPYLSSSANHIFDLTVGVGTSSALYPPGPATQPNKKRNLYNQMAQVLMGYDATGTIQRFDQDGDLVAGGVKYDDLIFINFARLLGKDEIKKGTFQIIVDTVQTYNAAGPFPYNPGAVPVNTQLVIGDTGAENDYRVNSPAGEYGILSVEQLTPVGGGAYIPQATYLIAEPLWEPRCGLIFYQAGVVALTKDIFNVYVAPGGTGKIHATGADSQMNGVPQTVNIVLDTGTIDDLSTAFRNRMHKVCFNNTTELNSTIYFARVNHNDFNYSSNPTYTSDSKIQVKSQSTDAPIAYITTVGLYSADNELLAVAKLSEPIKKTPENELTFRVRLDY